MKFAVSVPTPVPVVYRRIGGSPQGLHQPFRRMGYRTLMRRAVVTVAVANRLRADTIEEFGLDPRRVVTIPNGVDPLDDRAVQVAR